MFELRAKSLDTSVALKHSPQDPPVINKRGYSLYKDFFGLAENPFSLTPDPKYLYLSSKHKEALGHLYFGLEEKHGFIAITGEVGTGKTTLCRAFLKQLAPEYEVAYILNPCLTALELLQNINREFGLPTDNDYSKKTLIDRLNEFLLEKKRQDKTVIVIIDEAQNLEPEVLEQIRLISNLETNTEKLIQIVLIGQPELNVLLNSHNLRQLNQRITVKWHIYPLNYKETFNYIRHRLKVAGATKRTIRFSKMAIRKIYHYSKGFPRLINIIAHMAMLIAYADNKNMIKSNFISKAMKEMAHHKLQSKGEKKNRIYKIPFILIFCFIVIVLGYSTFSNQQEVPISLKAPPLPKAEIMEKPSSFNRLSETLGQLSEEESRSLSIFQIINLWGIDNLNESKINLNLLSHEITGTLEDIRKFNLPAVLEVNLQEEKRYIPLCSIQGDDAIVSIKEDFRIRFQDLKLIWSGKGWIYWKDFENLSQKIKPGDKGIEVKWLQLNLKELGYIKGAITSVLDKETIEAIKAFQKKNGIKDDGIFGAGTKILLYNRLNHTYPSPTLVRTFKNNMKTIEDTTPNKGS